MLRVASNFRGPISSKASPALACRRYQHSDLSTRNDELKPPVTIEEPGESGRASLYYHLLPVQSNQPTNSSSSKYKWALSLLPRPPLSGALDDRSILGVLPAQTGEPSNMEGASIDNFEQNPRFVETLHEAVRVVLNQDEDEDLKAEAQVRGHGWMHISDQRTTPALNRTPDPEDIIGSVMVDNGKIVPDSYQKMPTYRVVSGESGPLALGRRLSSALIRLLQS